MTWKQKLLLVRVFFLNIVTERKTEQFFRSFSQHPGLVCSPCVSLCLQFKCTALGSSRFNLMLLCSFRQLCLCTVMHGISLCLTCLVKPFLIFQSLVPHHISRIIFQCSREQAFWLPIQHCVCNRLYLNMWQLGR